MKKIISKIPICTFIVAVLFYCTSCDNKLDIQQAFPFTVEIMPVQTTIATGNTVEIRCNLKSEGQYTGAVYTIRYFQSAGKGSLRMNDGSIFKPNDSYPLKKNVFRLYYTSASTDQQTINIFVEDNFGQVVQLSFTFTNETAGTRTGTGTGTGTGRRIARN
jgi:hypothetical protein